jgi:transcriptional regulator with XRE-family HTH domain
LTDLEDKSVGQIIKELRLKNDLSQAKLSEGICSIQHLYRLEQGKRLPSAYLLKLLSERLGYELIVMLFDIDYKW